MSKIDELIAQYCPDGVEYKELGNACNFRRGKTITAKNAVDGDIPVIAGGQKPSYYHNEANRIGETISISSSGAYAGFVNYWTIPVFLSDSFSVDVDNNILVTKYVFYYLKSLQNEIHNTKKGSGVPHVHGSSIAKFSIPIPPLPVQEAIVEILDKFTALEAELEAELEARTRQYEYYRNELLSFQGKDVEWKMLKNVIELKRGTRVVKSQLQISGDIPVYQNSLKPLGYFNASNSDANSTYIICAGAAGDLGFSKVPFWAADDCFVFKKNNIVNSKFLYYFLKTKQEFLYSRVRRASIPRSSRESIDNIKIPLPSIEEQNRIVAILDKFDALVNDISTGLPAEIKARREQYEYYRGKLLSFEPKSA
jgi:type I restriction enzyme S subunit